MLGKVKVDKFVERENFFDCKREERQYIQAFKTKTKAQQLNRHSSRSKNPCKLKTQNRNIKSEERI